MGSKSLANFYKAISTYFASLGRASFASNGDKTNRFGLTGYGGEVFQNSKGKWA